MRIEVSPDETGVANCAADLIAAAVAAKSRASLGLPTGVTPIRTYAELNRRVLRTEIDLREATGYAIDEFVGAATAAPGTNAAFYAEHLRLPLRALDVPDANAADPDAEIRALARRIAECGGFDLCMLGIGANGHIAFNEPGSTRESQARVVELTPPSRAAHAGSFGGIDLVPRRGMTLGVADLLASRAIVVLATGAGKAAIVRTAIEDAESSDVPASWLQSHANVTWLIDADAARRLNSR